jgi:hypothetical protein
MLLEAKEDELALVEVSGIPYRLLMLLAVKEDHLAPVEVTGHSDQLLLPPLER